MLPWRSDLILKQAIEAYPHLRILRQPLPETLLGFLCSSTKQIPQIKQILRLSAESHGEITESDFKCLPTWEILAGLEENQLRKLKLGYRANYIKKSADFCVCLNTLVVPFLKFALRDFWSHKKCFPTASI